METFFVYFVFFIIMLVLTPLIMLLAIGLLSALLYPLAVPVNYIVKRHTGVSIPERFAALSEKREKQIKKEWEHYFPTLTRLWRKTFPHSA